MAAGPLQKSASFAPTHVSPRAWKGEPSSVKRSPSVL